MTDMLGKLGISREGYRLAASTDAMLEGMRQEFAAHIALTDDPDQKEFHKLCMELSIPMVRYVEYLGSKPGNDFPEISQAIGGALSFAAMQFLTQVLEDNFVKMLAHNADIEPTREATALYAGTSIMKDMRDCLSYRLSRLLKGKATLFTTKDTGK